MVFMVYAMFRVDREVKSGEGRQRSDYVFTSPFATRSGPVVKENARGELLSWFRLLVKLCRGLHEVNKTSERKAETSEVITESLLPERTIRPRLNDPTQ